MILTSLDEVRPGMALGAGVHNPEGQTLLGPDVPLTGVVAIATGAFHTCAITSTGGLKCWGANTFGEAGNGTIDVDDRGVWPPATVTGINDATALVALRSATLALTTTGLW